VFLCLSCEEDYSFPYNNITSSLGLAFVFHHTLVSEMEFERRTKEGKARAAMNEGQIGKGKKTVTEVEELLQAEVDSEAIRDGLKARKDSTMRDEEINDSESIESGSNGFYADSIAHNLTKATAFVEKGDELSAALLPLRLSSIRIEGAKEMRKSFLTRICKPYTDATIKPTFLNKFIYAHRLDQIMPGQSTSLPGLIGLLGSIGTDLGGLDAFADIQASLQPSLVVNPIDPSSPLIASEEDVDVVFTCKQKPRFFLKTSTDVGNGEGNAAIQARIRNVFGGAEQAEFSATTGTRTRQAFNGSLSLPMFALPDHLFTVSAYAQDRDLSAFSSVTEGARGAKLAMRINRSGMGGGIHEIAYELTHRHLGRLKPTASLSMRYAAGHSVKSSISHTFTHDTRDDTCMATSGILFKTLCEYAGLGGDQQHVKAEIETQLSRRFGILSSLEDQFAVSFSARTGFLSSFNGRSPAFSDRFQLGGPTSVRMFRYNSLGPKDGLDSLGGDAYFSTGTSLIAPFWPGKAHWPLKWHAFVNAGQLIQLDHNKLVNANTTISNGNVSAIWSDMLSKPSCSAGVGLMIRQSGLRAEINVGVPLTIRKGDGGRKGVQLGIGIDFL
jgi:outer membrane protein insertion porin family